MAVWRGYLYKGHIQGQNVPFEQEMDLTQKNGDIIAPRGVYALAHIASHKTGIQSKGPIERGQSVLGIALGMYGDDFNVMELIMPGTQPLYELIGGHGRPLKEHPVSGGYYFYRFFYTYDFH
jgi:hypothetical protein